MRTVDRRQSRSPYKCTGDGNLYLATDLVEEIAIKRRHTEMTVPFDWKSPSPHQLKPMDDYHEMAKKQFASSNMNSFLHCSSL